MPLPRRRTGWLSAIPEDESLRGPSAAGHTGDGPGLPVLDAVPGGPRLARAIVLAVLTMYATLQTTDVLTSPLPSHGLELGIDIPAIGMLYLLTIWVTSSAAEESPLWQRLAVLAAECVITFIPVAVFARLWGDMAGYLAGSALLLLTGWLAWTLFGAVILSILVLASVLTGNAYDTSYLTLSTLVLGLVVFGLARLSLLISYVNARRGELAQLAVISERMRFARDLHDLLGYSLSAITLKAEFTRRLIGTNPGRARDELAEVLDIARQALADVRIVASGYRNISLAKEASSVSALLAAAGIDAQVDINCGMLDESVDTVLATVLREAVTNMLRHSTARHCTIEASITDDTIHLHVANDGVPRTTPASTHRGGLDNLSTRMTSIGGTITTQIRDGWFTVHAQTPLTPAQAEQDV
jgi:two-component system, NarL family, sensor histidine kinase DesK